jgi:hypothetical protein
MPLLLTTPVDTGDLDSFSYDRVKIINFRVDVEGEAIEFEVQFGSVVDNNWVPGLMKRNKRFSIRNEGRLDENGDLIQGERQEYNEVVSSVSLTDELIYDGVARVLYQWLLDNDHFVGTLD